MSSKTVSTGSPDVEARLQEALRELEDHAAKLERSNRDLEQFAYAASHDLQTPLRKVKSFSLLLQKELAPAIAEMDGEQRERVERYLSFVIEGAERSQQLINGLLSFSRIGRRLEQEPISLDACLDAALFILSEDIEDKGVRIVRSGALPSICGDESLITRVFQNLLGNAIKFRHDDRMPCIEVGCDEGPEAFTVFVKDNGIGIDERHQDRVFVIFQRIGNKKRGTGLGLALVKKIVESHRGKVWFESTLGEGSTFKFTVPKGTRCGESVDES